MFRKLVSNLPYCPALIEDVGFYAKRLRGEEATRKTALLFIVLALIMQSFAIFSPPEPANASSEQDIIRGGIANLEDLLTRFDRNDQDIKDIYTAVGISRNDLVNTKATVIKASESMFVLVRYNQIDNPSAESPVVYQRSAGGTDVRYFSSLSKIISKNTDLEGWLGQSKSLGPFAVLKSSGSILTYSLPAKPSSNNNGIVGLEKQITVSNLSKGLDKTQSKTAQPLDRIEYVLSLKNTTDSSLVANFTARLSDALEYSILLDKGGGSFAEKTNVLSWPPAQIAPGETQRRTFVVRLLAEIPSVGTGQSNPSSFDCTMTVEFGEEASVPVNCPLSKHFESFLGILPTVGTGISIGFVVVIFLVTAYFYVRTRQLKKEIVIVRHIFSSGTA